MIIPYKPRRHLMYFPSNASLDNFKTLSLDKLTNIFSDTLTGLPSVNSKKDCMDTSTKITPDMSRRQSMYHTPKASLDNFNTLPIYPLPKIPSDTSTGFSSGNLKRKCLDASTMIIPNMHDRQRTYFSPNASPFLFNNPYQNISTKIRLGTSTGFCSGNSNKNYMDTSTKVIPNMAKRHSICHSPDVSMDNSKRLCLDKMTENILDTVSVSSSENLNKYFMDTSTQITLDMLRQHLIYNSPNISLDNFKILYLDKLTKIFPNTSTSITSSQNSRKYSLDMSTKINSDITKRHSIYLPPNASLDSFKYSFLDKSDKISSNTGNASIILEKDCSATCTKNSSDMPRRHSMYLSSNVSLNNFKGSSMNILTKRFSDTATDFDVGNPKQICLDKSSELARKHLVHQSINITADNSKKSILFKSGNIPSDNLTNSSFHNKLKSSFGISKKNSVDNSIYELLNNIQVHYSSRKSLKRCLHNSECESLNNSQGVSPPKPKKQFLDNPIEGLLDKQFK